jgi:hypothetical protein
MKSPISERLAFLLSVVFLSFFYGFMTNFFGWFPSESLSAAFEQAHRLTGPPEFVAPRTYERQGVRAVEPEEIQSGVTLIAGHWKEFDWEPGLKLIANDGSTVHTWRVDPEQVFSDSALAKSASNRRGLRQLSIHGAHLFPDGDVLVNLNYAGTVRLDACGEVLWELLEGSHHSIERGDDGTFWIPGVSSEVRTGSPAYPDGHPGFDAPVFHDRILQVSETGRVLRRINLLDLLYANGLERHIAKARELRATDDVTHLNDIEPLSAAMAEEYPLFEAGDLAISLRPLDLVLVVDPETETVKWHASHPFISQHDPDFIGDGWIGVFDNNRDATERGTMLGGSRIVALQPHTDSIQVLFPTSRSEHFYTDIMGKWQRLENGNLLLTESTAARIVEVARDGRTVWEWVGEPYDDSRITEVSEGTRYDLTSEDVAEWRCSSNS